MTGFAKNKIGFDNFLYGEGLRRSNTVDKYFRNYGS
jgi:hypothetical protein